MTINANEELIIVDSSNHVIGSAPRYTALQDHYVRTSIVWLINDKHELLCQLRSKNKDSHPGLWDCCFGGHSSPGESPEDTAIDELFEESGIKAKKDELKLWD